jgi:kynurenine formamidase
MAQLPADKIFTFYALPLKLQGRDGAPVRAIAITD